MKKSVILPLILLLFVLVRSADAQQSKRPEVSLVFGLSQPLATNGFNFEVDYWFKKFVIDYSHGLGLEFTGNLVSPAAREQRLSFNVSHSVGFGFGYRFTRNLNLRLEPKWHVWEMYYDDQFKQPEGKVGQYTTYTLGLGLYYRWTPFARMDNALRGITIAPNARWWPNVGSTLPDNELQYFNAHTGRPEVHRANNIGISNTPYFVNVSVGYTFGMK
jgi:hypothetical protein